MTPAEAGRFNEWWRTHGSRICALLLHPDAETKAALRVSALEAYRAALNMTGGRGLLVIRTKKEEGVNE